jgi:hypothetical protein
VSELTLDGRAGHEQAGDLGGLAPTIPENILEASVGWYELRQRVPGQRDHGAVQPP